MRWTCPECKREFAAKNKFHSCIITTVDAHFKEKLSTTKELYDCLIKKIGKIGNITQDPVKTVILLGWRRKFCSIKVQSTQLKLQISLPRKISSSRVRKHIKKGNIHHHLVILSEKGQIDDELIGWFEEAYALGI